MKLKAFNKQLKKEFNENYNGKALVEIKEKKKKSIWIRLIPAYAILGILLIFGIVLGIDQLAVNDYNNRYYHLSDAYQNASYVELNKISEKEFKELKDFTPRQSILDKMQTINETFSFNLDDILEDNYPDCLDSAMVIEEGHIRSKSIWNFREARGCFCK